MAKIKVSRGRQRRAPGQGAPTRGMSSLNKGYGVGDPGEDFQLILADDVSGFFDRLRIKVDQAEDALEHLEEANERAAERQERRWVRNYASEGTEYGKRWQTTNLQYAHPDWQSTLVVTGNQKTYLPGYMEEDRTVTDHTVSWAFTNRVDEGYYAVSHHTGYTWERKNGKSVKVPPRNIWAFDARDERLNYRIYSETIHRRLKEIFG